MQISLMHFCASYMFLNSFGQVVIKDCTRLAPSSTASSDASSGETSTKSRQHTSTAFTVINFFKDVKSTGFVSSKCYAEVYPFPDLGEVELVSRRILRQAVFELVPLALPRNIFHCIVERREYGRVVVNDFFYPGNRRIDDIYARQDTKDP